MPAALFFSPVRSVVRCRQWGRRGRLNSVDAHGERVIRDIGNPENDWTRLEFRRQAAHRKCHRAVRRPISVGNPLHHVVVEPLELAGHRGRRLHVDGTLGRAAVGDRAAERHHNGVRDTDPLALRGTNRCDGEGVLRHAHRQAHADWRRHHRHGDPYHHKNRPNCRPHRFHHPFEVASLSLSFHDVRGAMTGGCASAPGILVKSSTSFDYG